MRLAHISLFLFLLVNVAVGQSFFTVVPEQEARKNISTDRSIVPSAYQVSDLNIGLLKKYLKQEVSKDDNGKMIYLINPEGEEKGFRIFETRMMQEGLAAKYPDIKTYKGYNPEARNERVYFGISSTGFYATVSQPGASYSIDRYADKQDRYYISYYQKDHIDEGAMSHTCGTTAKEIIEKEEVVNTRSAGVLLPLREYRFALACTGEFGAFYGPDIADVLGEMVKSVNRMNMVLENDFAVRLVLVNNNDVLINVDADNDPYPDGNTGGTLLGENTAVLNNRIGFGNFDLGHVYTRGCDDTGGIARIESACTAFKGAGVTCHYSNDITAMAIRVAAHEVGHQLGSNHTFNNCNGNENSSTAYEPGSGTTIMSYGGLCGSELNVINVADDYFHISSIIEITQYTRDFFGNSCPVKSETDNHIPDITLPFPDGFSIPISTPFELEGSAFDEDGDDLTYTWEQYNLGPMVVPGQPLNNSPLFVSAYPSPDPKRVFPRMSTIVNNTTEKTETLPTYERDLNFQFIVRDNNPASGGVAWQELEFYSTESAGPFLVEFPSAADTFQVGDEIEVLWDVANTDNEIVNCKAVDILLSTDGGFTYDLVLVQQTPNDGAQKIFMPNIINDSARIKIKASENIFFDISNENFMITEADEPGFLLNYSPSFVSNCVPDEIEIEITTEGFLGYDEIINLEVVNDLPEGMEVNFADNTLIPGEKTIATISFTNHSLTGTQAVALNAYTSTDTLVREVILDLVSTDFSDVVALFPEVGSSGNQLAPVLTWTGDSDAVFYEVKISDNPSFSEDNSELLYIETVEDTFFILKDLLSKNTTYYWQVIASNECGSEEDAEIYAFATEAISCNSYTYGDVPKGISQSGVIEIDMVIDIVGSGEVRDVNVKRIKGIHTWVSELKGELTSPMGTKVLLFRNKCGNQSNFNAGFDDDAGGGVTCPLNQGIFYQPEQKLDTFVGEQISGEWLFKLTDTKIGNGGAVQEYILEVCSNEVLEGPSLVTNAPMALPSGVGRRLSADFLLTEDSNNSDEELIYTLVRLPQNGSLRNEDEALMVGSQFSQKDLNENRIRYQHDGNSDDDRFYFTVQDGEGGWISITPFEIVIDNDITIAVEETVIPNYRVFPNPVGEQFYLEFDVYQRDLSLELFDLMGRKIELVSKRSGDRHVVTLSSKYVPGIYLLNVKGDGFSDVRKLMIK